MISNCAFLCCSCLYDNWNYGLRPFKITGRSVGPHRGTGVRRGVKVISKNLTSKSVDRFERIRRRERRERREGKDVQACKKVPKSCEATFCLLLTPEKTEDQRWTPKWFECRFVHFLLNEWIICGIHFQTKQKEENVSMYDRRKEILTNKRQDMPSFGKLNLAKMIGKLLIYDGNWCRAYFLLLVVSGGYFSVSKTSVHKIVSIVASFGLVLLSF